MSRIFLGKGAKHFNRGERGERPQSTQRHFTAKNAKGAKSARVQRTPSRRSAQKPICIQRSLSLLCDLCESLANSAVKTFTAGQEKSYGHKSQNFNRRGRREKTKAFDRKERKERKGRRARARAPVPPFGCPPLIWITSLNSAKAVRCCPRRAPAHARSGARASDQAAPQLR